MKYSLRYMFRPQLGHHQALYMHRSFVQHIYNLYEVFTRLHVSAPTGPSSGLIYA